MIRGCAGVFGKYDSPCTQFIALT